MISNDLQLAPAKGLWYLGQMVKHFLAVFRYSPKVVDAGVELVSDKGFKLE